MLLVGCDPVEPQQGAARDDVLRGTDALKDFGDYVIYVNALLTDQLTPDIAREYGIVRSKSRAMLTISVHKKQPEALPMAVTGDLHVTAVNLTGQIKNVLMRDIVEEDAIYYIGELEVNDGETLIYTVDVTPAGAEEGLSLRYQKQFFVDE